MIIIVEGPDGAGKTTLIGKLQMSIKNTKVIHFSNPKTDEEAFNYWKVYATAIKEATGTTIFDRSWYSDMVYGPVFRGREEMSQLQASMLEALVVTNGGGFVIYCTAPTNVLWTRCQRRGETFVRTYEKLREIVEGYKTVFTNSILPVVKNDTYK
jgi:thymidylate kinase